MGILSRFGEIMEANINALLDKAEDPAKMIDQYMRQAMDDLADVKAETAQVMAEEKRCKRLRDDAQEDVNKYQAMAEKAVLAGNDGDARELLARKANADQALATAQKTYEVAKANAEKMKQMHNKLAAEVETLRARKANVKATLAVAKTQERMTKAGDAMHGAKGSMAAFDRMEQKAQERLDAAEAAAELSGSSDPQGDDLEAKYGAGGTANVDDALAALKAKLGKD